MSDPESTPPPLQRLQAAMAGLIRRHGNPDDGAFEPLAWITVPFGEDRRRRLAVYTDGYPARMHEALREAFPALAHIVGARTFAEFVDRYCAAVDIPATNLNSIGEMLPEFLCNDIAAHELPFLPDLARLEWLVQQAFHATHAVPIDPAAMHPPAGRGWEDVCLDFQPGLGVVRSAWPVLDLWQARDTPRGEIDINLTGRPQNVVVWRDGFEVRCDAVSDAEATVLHSLRNGMTLGQAIARIESEIVDPASVAGWFAGWLQTGRIVAARY
jgi:hypothetical protein